LFVRRKRRHVREKRADQGVVGELKQGERSWPRGYGGAHFTKMIAAANKKGGGGWENKNRTGRRGYGVNHNFRGKDTTTGRGRVCQAGGRRWVPGGSRSRSLDIRRKNKPQKQTRQTEKRRRVGKQREESSARRKPATTVIEKTSK